MNQFALRWAVIPMLLLVWCAVMIAYWSFDRAPPVVYLDNAKVEVIDHDTVRLSFVQERKRFCDVDIVRWLEDQDGFRYYFAPLSLTAEQVRNLHLRSPNRVNVIIRVPQRRTALPRTFEYGAFLSFACNPLQQFVNPIEVEYVVPFTLD